MVITVEPLEPIVATMVVLAEAVGAIEIVEAVSVTSTAQTSAAIATRREGSRAVISVPSGDSPPLSRVPHPLTFEHSDRNLLAAVAVSPELSWRGAGFSAAPGSLRRRSLLGGWFSATAVAAGRLVMALQRNLADGRVVAKAAQAASSV